MRFEDSLSGDVAVFQISGKIMGGEEATLFHGRVRENINLNKKSIVIDLTKVDWINSVGLGMLISALTTVKNAGGRLVLANITSIESILSLTRLIKVFENYDSLQAALDSFGD
ncbi:MAG: STAS domain-containing protein [candidate division Zixibacteria bacterium]|nr:STAS domain-containing protein [candidate division Zixibacteria bacterium]MDH3938652.1 STAS domain-containing protein [candidate division Zixibacteria bacterium]MDH4032834.1 STAS domain-containing protein [candidate division Zixibacteria bacterium]